MKPQRSNNHVVHGQDGLNPALHILFPADVSLYGEPVLPQRGDDKRVCETVQLQPGTRFDLPERSQRLDRLPFSAKDSDSGAVHRFSGWQTLGALYLPQNLRGFLTSALADAGREAQRVALRVRL